MSIDVVQLIFALPASLGFAMFFNVRRSLWVPSALGGLASWAVFVACRALLGGLFVPCLLASAVAALYGEVLGRIFKTPSSVFFVIAVIPLIPGRSLFSTMSNAVSGQWDLFFGYGLETLIYASAIAVGISAVWACVEVIERVRGKAA